MPNHNLHRTHTADFSGFSTNELEVAGIMLNLRDFLKKSESSFSVPPLWTVKKKRSSLQPELQKTPSNSPPVTGKLDTLSASPVSPMAFPSSIESDLKLHRPKKKAALGVKAELLKESKKLTERREQLQTEITKVKAHRDELMAENKLLQSRRQQVMKASSSLPVSQSQSLVTVAQPHYLQQPLILFQYKPSEPRNMESKGPGEKSTVRVEQLQPSDFEYHFRIWMGAMAKNRAAAALARRNRSLILKAKNHNKVPRGGR